MHIFKFPYVCVDICHVYGGSHRGKKKAVDVPEMDLQINGRYLMWVLGTKLHYPGIVYALKAK